MDQIKIFSREIMQLPEDQPRVVRRGNFVTLYTEGGDSAIILREVSEEMGYEPKQEITIEQMEEIRTKNALRFESVRKHGPRLIE